MSVVALNLVDLWGGYHIYIYIYMHICMYTWLLPLALLEMALCSGTSAAGDPRAGSQARAPNAAAPKGCCRPHLGWVAASQTMGHVGG